MHKRSLIKRNLFNLNHEVLMSGKFGLCYPCFLKEVMPADTFNITTDLILRTTPLVSPAMNDLRCKIHFFFVPSRLLWDNWEKFITGGEDGRDESVQPYVMCGEDIPNGGAWSTGRALLDYMGIPPGCKQKINSLPIRAYYRIWNEWYRNEVLQEEIKIPTDDGDDTKRLPGRLLLKNWEKDYFTSAFPFAQKGDPVYLPLGNSAPVDITLLGDGTKWRWTDGNGVNNIAVKNFPLPQISNTFSAANPTDAATGLPLGVTQNFEYQSGMKAIGTADLSLATAATVEEVRMAFQIQKVLWKNLEGGSRYIEYLYNFYGVVSSDARLQRSEYLGECEFNIMINEVVQTSESSEQNTPTATLYGKGLAVGESHTITKSFEEFGYIIGIFSCLPKTVYMDGIQRLFLRETRYDYPNPCFVFLGYQEIYTNEVWGLSPTEDKSIFGFQGRYDEYRHAESYVTGDFRTTLSHWHSARSFSEKPLLNPSFITGHQAPTRIFSDAVDDYLLLWLKYNVTVSRGLPKYNEVGLIDHIYK